MGIDTLEVLLVEDNPGDIVLLKEILIEKNNPFDLEVITNGEDALNFLLKNGEYHNSPKPDVIILDLNLPRKSGKEILEFISTDESLKKIPIIIFTSADIDDEIFTNSSYNIKYYLIKPLEVDEYLKVVQFMRNFILSLSRES